MTTFYKASTWSHSLFPFSSSSTIPGTGTSMVQYYWVSEFPATALYVWICSLHASWWKEMGTVGREMVSWLRTLAALVKGLSSVPSTHVMEQLTTSWNSCSKGTHALFPPLGALIHVQSPTHRSTEMNHFFLKRGEYGGVLGWRRAQDREVIQSVLMPTGRIREFSQPLIRTIQHTVSTLCKAPSLLLLP